MNILAHARTRARRYALQALYQWDLSGTDINEIRSQFLETQDFSRVDRAYFDRLLKEVPQAIDSIDKNIAECIDRPLRQLDPVEHAVLRIAVCELLLHADVPYRVVINEAVLLAKKFGAEQGHAFVNGVLDQVARRLRAEAAVRDSKQASEY
ncbi:MAG: transcription antitermination factor NusB [Gammaproteobacteria bacterium]|jgi:N utilization substance protein B